MIGKIIKAKRLEKHLTLEDIAKYVGTSKQTIQRYESGVISNIPSDKIELIAQILGTTPAVLMGWEDDSFYNNYDNIIPLPKTKQVPLLGTIACGEPILADENIEAYINMPLDVSADFALKCKGDSMINARIFNGDIVYIRKQPDVENGEIAAVLIDNEATLKRVYKFSDRIILKAENPTIPEFTYRDEEMANVKIIGKAVAFLSAVR